MENPNTVSALIRKRAEIAGEIEHYQAVLRQKIIDLDNLDATIRLFAPDIDLEEVKPKRLPPRHAAYKGEVSRIIFGALRNAEGPMTAHQLAQEAMADRGLNTTDKKLVRAISKRVGSSLRHYRSKGVVRSIEGQGSFLFVGDSQLVV